MILHWRILVLGVVCLASATESCKVSFETYQAYLESHGKPLNRLNDVSRFAAYCKTSEFVNSHISGLSYSVGLNEMADWLPHEIPQTNASIKIPLETISSHILMQKKRKKQLRRIENVDRFLLWHRPASPWSLTTNKLGTGGESTSSLNWGSTDNPYNVSIVGEVSNQGSCGACWSFVATSAVEATVYISSGIHVRLSEQELIDCDRNFNQGCNGGNPVYAFNYIMKWGLTNQQSYPYREEQHARCRREQHVSKAAIQGFLRLPSGDQALIKRFLNMGPIATGICGTDPSFLYYTGGLYDRPDCCQAQNHAVLLVGYGYDDERDVGYFIIKNSWGKFWGENGYMRLAIREGGTEAGEGAEYQGENKGGGVCGVALGPSLPTNGMLLPGYTGSAARAKGRSHRHDRDRDHGGHTSEGDADDDSYTDDVITDRKPFDPQKNNPGGIIAWLKYYVAELYLLWVVNSTNRLFLFSLALFVCSCGLCLYSVYDDCRYPEYEERINTEQYQELSWVGSDVESRSR